MAAEVVAKPAQLLVKIDRSPAGDEQESSELADNLRADLIEAGMESIEQVRGGEAPAGSKGDALTLSALVITLGPTALTGLFAMLQSWLTRHERTSLTLQKGDQKITVTGTLSKEQKQVISDWIRAEKAA